MKIEMNGETYVKGVQEFYKTTNYLNVKKMKNRSIILLVMGVLFIVFGIIDKEMRNLMIVCGSIIIVCCIFLLFAPIINEKNIQKNTKNNSINKIECDVENNVIVKTTFNAGSENVFEYEFKDIEKLKESENFYFMYIDKYSAVPIAKDNIENASEFISVFKKNNVLVEE